jgi:hypothetical protein
METSTMEPTAVDGYWSTSHKSARSSKSTRIRPSIIWMSPAVVPGARADERSVHEKARSVVAVGCASIGIVRVVAVRANRRASDIAAADSDSDSHSDPYRSLCIRKRHGQYSKQCNISQVFHK